MDSKSYDCMIVGGEAGYGLAENYNGYRQVGMSDGRDRQGRHRLPDSQILP